MKEGRAREQADGAATVTERTRSCGSAIARDRIQGKRQSRPESTKKSLGLRGPKPRRLSAQQANSLRHVGWDQLMMKGQVIEVGLGPQTRAGRPRPALRTSRTPPCSPTAIQKQPDLSEGMILLRQIDGAAALQRPTSAGYFFNFPVEVVIDRQFLSRLDFAGTDVEDVILHDARHDVRLTAMVDVLCARSVHCSVKGPVGIEREKVGELLLIRPALGFLPADALSGVLNHLSMRRDGLTSVDAPAVDFRGRYDQFETSVLSIDVRGAANHRLSVHRRFRASHFRQVSGTR